MINFLIIFVIICNISDNHLGHGSEMLTNALEDLTQFFEKLKTKYENHSLNLDTLNQIDKKINSYIENASNPINRYKRHDSFNNAVAINILEGFDEISTFNVQDFKHATFFPLKFNGHLFWFMAGINSNGISLYQLNNKKFNHVKTYSQYNGVRIIVDNSMHDTIAIIQTFIENIIILQFNYIQTAYALSFVQTIQIPGITDIHTWHYMNDLYLGIASHHNISIYIWTDAHFDLIQTLDFGAEKLTFFQNKGFMNLICNSFRTVILRHSLHLNKFIIIQTLPASNAITTFDVIKGHLKEYYICLSTHKNTVIYKEVHGYLISFQEISSSEKIIPLIDKNAIVLLSLNKNIVTIYQYDGWKFVKLNVNMSEINNIYLINIYENKLMFITHGVTTWKLLQPKWGEIKSLIGLKNEIKTWCVKATAIAQRIPKATFILKTPLSILNGHIREIDTQNINGYDSKELQNLTRQYEYLSTQIQTMNDYLNKKINNSNIQLKTLRANKVQVRCESQCKVNNIIITGKDNPLFKLKSIKDINQNITFSNLKVKNINNFKCPIIALTPTNLYLKGLINNVSLSDLQENTLKISGDQIVQSDHIFVELHVDHSIVPLNIATNFTTQTVHAKKIYVKELHVKKDGFLLPLNGPPSKISGCITVKNVNVTGQITLKGGLRGKGASLLMPIKRVPDFMEINGNRHFHNITIINTLRTKDIYSQNGKTLKVILNNGILINNKFPRHVIFSNNAIWKNVTIKDYNNWVTAYSDNTVIISGKKLINHGVILPRLAYTPSFIPKLNLSLCVSTANVTNLILSKVLIDNMTVNHLKSFHVFGAKELNSTIFETTTSIDSIDLSTKYFIGVITVKDILPFDIKGFHLKGFQEILNTWIGKNIFKDIQNVTSLKVNNLQVPARFTFPLPTKVKNVISKGNTYAKIVNGEDIKRFMKNVVRIDDRISLNNITFNMGLKSNNIQFSYGSLNITDPAIYPHLHSKHILGNMQVEKLNIPKPIIDETYNTFKNYIIQGNVTFISEPTVQNINNINLKKFSSEMYTIDKNMILTLLGNNITKTSLYIPHYGSWTNMSYNLLSKTKPQVINVPCWFNNIEVYSIQGSPNLSIQTSDSNIKNIIEKSFKKNVSQVITGKWHFDKLILPGQVNLQGKINNMDLRTDVMKHSSETNVVTGMKTVLGLTTKNLHGLNFSEWSQNAVLSNHQNVIVIKGQKTFADINLSSLSLDGTIMGKKIENALLKSKPQIINGTKTFDGNIIMPSLLIDGLVNDINLTSFTSNLLKKNKSVQILETDIILKDKNNLTEIIEIVKVAGTALNNRAFYLNKLKIVKNMNALITNLNINYIENMNSSCNLKNVSLFCNNIEIQDFSLGSDISNYTRLQILSVRETTIIVFIKSDCVSIGNIINARFYQKKVFCIPNILKASIESVENSLWIILQLPLEMLAFHYVSWDNVKQYTLPPSNMLLTIISPNKELLMLRSDGVWNINELGRPRHIFQTNLTGTIETFFYDNEYYFKNIINDGTIFMKPVYVGN
ncbi:PREDICTED: uncharacterized protein LOC107072855 [Polistes dominula]|uniref:Uncharacterized protein LOC107072855 n=1 Tax=Polistes dominula TaxID=743375 RepID=A0ABM1J824_POLDO|nr:PREDICTED: uncharacterized protein LOC107072855 [Polistes dominula]